MHLVEEGELTISCQTFDPEDSKVNLMLAAATYESPEWGPANENDPNLDGKKKYFFKVSICYSQVDISVEVIFLGVPASLILDS